MTEPLAVPIPEAARLGGVGRFLAGGKVEGGEGAAFEFGALRGEVEGEEGQDEEDFDG